MFARAGFEAKPKEAPAAVPTAAAAAAAPAAEAKNACPPALKKAIDESYEKFIKNKEGDTTSEGEKWELVNQTDVAKIWRAKLPGQSVYRWRAEQTLYGPKSGIVAELFDFSKRAGPNGWDEKLKAGRIHKQYDDNYRVAIFSSNPVFGGVISSREFIEARVIKPEQPDGGYLVAGMGLDEKIWGPVLGDDFPKGDKSCTRALAFPGGGFCMSPVTPGTNPETPQEWKCQLVMATLLGGWIPTGTINAASAQVMTEAAVAQRDHMLKKFKQ